MTIQLRDVRDTDIDSITEIYATEVIEHVNTYEYDVPNAAEMRHRMHDIVGRGFPYIVAEIDDKVAGYAYANTYRGRIAYRWTVENSVYVDPAFQGRGVGIALMQHLIDACTARGYRQMVAVIGAPSNTASIKLHERFGFHTVGIFRGIGRKHGHWLDTVQMQRALGDGDATAPSDE